MAMLTATEPLTVEQFVAEMTALPTNLEREGFRDALAACRAVILQDVAQHFGDQLSGDGSRWPPRKDKLTHPLLILSSLLFQSSVGNAAGKVDRLEDRELELGIDKTAVPYAGVHQFGYPKRNIPQRQYWWVSDDAIEECEGIIAEHLNDLLFS